MNEPQDQPSLTLIDGKFQAHDARDILLSLINFKIDYHQVKNFSNKLRTGSDIDADSLRVVQLKNTREQVIRIIEQAAASGQSLKIRSEIVIEISEEKPQSK